MPKQVSWQTTVANAAMRGGSHKEQSTAPTSAQEKHMPDLPTTTADPDVPAPQAPTPPEPQGNWWDLPDPNDPALQAGPQAPAPQAPAQPMQPDPNQWFLRSADGTIAYRTPEEALKGKQEADRTIAQQKAELERTRQILAASGVHLGNTPPQAQVDDPLFSALETYVSQPEGQRQPAAFTSAVRQLMQNEFQEMFQPFLPLAEHSAMNIAVETAGQQFDPNIPSFVRSQAYARTLDKWPALKTAIQTAARYSHIQTPDGRTYGSMLPELLAQAHLVAKAAAPTAPAQRTAPQSSTPPQTFAPGTVAPQGPQVPVGGVPLGKFRDPFDVAYENIPDLPLS